MRPHHPRKLLHRLLPRPHRTLTTTTTPHPLPPKQFSHFIITPQKVAIIGAPLADGQPLLGVDRGPTFIRSHGLVQRLEQDAWQVDDQGDLDFQRQGLRAPEERVTEAGLEAAPHGSTKRAELVGHANRIIFNAVYQQATAGNFALTLGGDHSIGVGSVAGALKARPDAAVIWVDAHADINSHKTSVTGHLHGMVLSFLMDLDGARRGETKAGKGFEWLEGEKVPVLSPRRLIYVGLRDLDAGEKAFIRGLGIKAYTMHEVDKYGIGKVMEMVLDHVLDRQERPLHLSFDIDAVDPLYAPSTGTRVAGGLSYREAYYICEEIAHSGCLASMDLVEVNPTLITAKGDERTVDMAVGLISSALGNSII